MTAAFVGSREIGFAVVATTLKLASVYLPIGFLPGMMGALFQEFAFTLAAAVMLSGFISRKLSPMICSRILVPAKPPPPSRRWLNPLVSLEDSYSSMLDVTRAQERSGGKKWVI